MYLCRNVIYIKKPKFDNHVKKTFTFCCIFVMCNSYAGASMDYS